MAAPILYIGNKNYSSWSMRPWLALKWGGIEFEERVIPLGGEGYGRSQIKEVREVSPSGRVPALHIDGAVVYESLAICEWAAEAHPSLWPADRITRARARSVAAQIHAGFAALRRDMSMNIRRRVTPTPQWPEDTSTDLEDLYELWSSLLNESGGPYLFGELSIADAMYAPVVTRLRTYSVQTPDIVRGYCEAVLGDAAFREWERGALAEVWTIEQTEALYR